jgi:hypothetical protein
VLRKRKDRVVTTTTFGGNHCRHAARRAVAADLLTASWDRALGWSYARKPAMLGTAYRLAPIADLGQSG